VTAGHRSWSPGVAAEERLQGREGLRGQGRKAGGEVRDRLRVDLRRSFCGSSVNDVGTDVACFLISGFSAGRLWLFDPCRGSHPARPYAADEPQARERHRDG
jgi:hypothetical protein